MSQNMAAQGNESFQYKYIGLESGLSSQHVFGGLQDTRGFMWFATENGLNRYDGNSMKVYDKNNGLRRNFVAKIAEDAQSRLWILYGKEFRGFLYSTGEVDLMDPVSGEIRPLTESIPSLPFQESDVVWVQSNELGELFILLRPHTIYKYDSKGAFSKVMDGEKCKFITPGGREMNGELANSFDSRGGIISLAAIGYIKSNQLIAPVAQQEIPGYLSSWHLTNAGPECFYLIDGALIRSKIINSEPTEWDTIRVSGLETGAGISYMARSTLSDAFLLQASTEYYLYYGDKVHKLPKAFIDLNRNAPFSFFLDRKGSYWLCTLAGVHFIHFDESLFSNYFQASPGGIEVVMGNQIRAINADMSGNIFASIRNLVLHCNAVNRDTKIGKTPLNQETMVIFDKGPWQLGFGTEVIRYDYTQKDFAPKGYALEICCISMATIWTVLPLPTGEYLLGGDLGVRVLNQAISECRRLKNDENGFPKMGQIYKIIKSKYDGQYWAAGILGLFRISPDFVITDYFGEKATSPFRQLTGSGFYHLLEDKDNIFWLATVDRGLIRFDRKNNTVKAFTIRDGLPSNTLYCIEEDDFGCLWFSTDRGLVRFDKSSYALRIFTKQDGLPENEFNRVSSFKRADGRMYFGTIDGLTSFDPKDFMETDSSMASVELVVSVFQQYDGRSGQLQDLTKQLIQANQIVMQPDDKFFQIKVALLDFIHQPLYYEYRVEGLESNWSYSKDGNIRVSNLPYGNYTLRIKAINQSGQWAKEEIVISVLVLRPFYATWWFALLTFVAVVAGVVLFIHYRTGQLEKSKELLAKMVNQRTDELSGALADREDLLKEVHHRVKNNLQVISSLLDLQRHEIDDAKMSREFDVAKLRIQSVATIHQILYENENFSEVAFMQTAQKLFLQVQQVYRGNSNKVRFIQEGSPNLLINLDTTIVLGLLLNEMMTNSFKYAFENIENPEISLALHEDGKDDYRYSLSYSDNGNGLPEGFDIKKLSSLGFVIIQDLTRQINGQLDYFNQNGLHLEIRFNGIFSK